MHQHCFYYFSVSGRISVSSLNSLVFFSPPRVFLPICVCLFFHIRFISYHAFSYEFNPFCCCYNGIYFFHYIFFCEMDDTYKSSSRTKRNSTFGQFLPCGSPPTTGQERTCNKTSLTSEAWAVRTRRMHSWGSQRIVGSCGAWGFLGLGRELDGSKRD